MHYSDKRRSTRVTGVRKLDRSVAKHNMKVAEVPKPNKQMSKINGTTGMKNWREWAYPADSNNVRRRRRA